MIAAGLVFAATRNFWLLLLAGIIGVVSPSGNEVGPFLSIEQAALSDIVRDRERTEVFAWYTLAGSLAMALGALAGGGATRVLQRLGLAPVGSYRGVVLLYAALGGTLIVLFSQLSSAAEATADLAKKPSHATLAHCPASPGREASWRGCRRSSPSTRSAAGS